MASFGENLKTLRVAKDISQGDLAERIGVHATHISRYERDLTQPTLDVIKRIAEALHVSADELIYGDTDKMAKAKLQDKELLHLFAQVQALKKDDLHCVKSLLNAYILKTELQQKLS